MKVLKQSLEKKGEIISKRRGLWAPMVVSPTIFIFSLQTLKEFLMIKTRLLRSSKTWVTLKAFGHPGSPVFPPWVSWQQQEKQGKTTAKS